MVGPVFRQFFHAAMQEAQYRRRLDDALPFQRQNDLEHPMRAGMLGPHVQHHLLGAQGRKRRVFRVRRVDVINRLALVFEGGFHQDFSPMNVNVSRHPLPRSGKSLRSG